MNIPLLMVIAFLALTLIVGLYFSKKTTTLREYAVGNQNFSTATLVMTTLATGMGAPALVSIVEEVHNQGLLWVIIMPLSALSYWIIRPLALRMGPFMQHLSMAETIGAVYGNSLRIITSLICIVASTTYIALQIQIMSIAINACIGTGFSSNCITIITTCILIFYATCGGIRAVTFTDILQFITFTLIIPFLAVFMFQHTGKSFSEIIPFLQNYEKFQLKSVFGFNTRPIAVVALLLTCLFSAIEPPIMQRVYMSSNPVQAQKVLSFSTIFCFIIGIHIILVGVFTFIGSPKLSNIWMYIFEHIPFPFKGFLAISLLAMAMSTADSNLNSCAIMVSHDILGTLHEKIKGIPALHTLWLARVTVLIVGFSAMATVFYRSNLWDLMLLAINWYIPTVLAPFILAIYGFRGSAHTALIGISIGGFSIWLWDKKILPQTNIEGSFFCMLANGLAMMIAHYLLPQRAGTGWVKPDDTYTAYKQNKTWKTKLKKESLRAVFAHPKVYLNTLKPSGPKLIGSGIYIIINGFISFIYYWEAGWHLGSIALSLIGFFLVSYVLFLKKHAIPDWFVTLYLWLALLCALPIHSLFSWYYLPLPLLTLALSCSHVALLLFLLPLYAGLLMAMPLCCLYFCCCYKIASTWPSVQLFLPLLGTGMLLFGFMLYAKNQLDRSVVQRKLVELRNAYEQRVALEAIYNQANLARLDAYTGSNLLASMSKTLQETLHSLDTTTNIKKEINLFLKKLDKVGHIWMDRTQAERSMALNPKDVSSIDITSTILKIYGYIRTLDSSIQFFLRNQSEIICIEADPALLECLVMPNIWELSKSRTGPDRKLTLTLSDTILHYGDSPTGTVDTHDAAALSLPAVAFAFSTDSAVRKISPHYTVMDTPTYRVLPREEQFYQLESKQIVEAHGGYTEMVETSKNLTGLYVLPVKGKQVMHFKTYDPPDLVAAKVAETAESLAQEKKLATLLTTHTSLTKARVAETIAFIKKAHGLVTRKSGAPYYIHPMEVAKILLEGTQDPDTILAGLLHDIVEDTPITLLQISLMYGPQVADIIDKVTEYHTNGYCWKLEKATQRDILGACGDWRVVQVKLADRLHNMRTLYARKPADQQRIARETLTFYIPWGKRNKGPQAWLREMQQICERVLLI